MRQPDVETQEIGTTSQTGICGEGVPLNGIDELAARRAHMRALTTARQAAEKRHARTPLTHSDSSPTAKQAAARARTVEYHSELARIEEEHQQWLSAHGEDLPAPRAPRRK